MRVAVFSDVHGNLTALEAVLGDIGKQTTDQIVCAGDLCLFGPQPADCLRRIRDAGIIALYGNTDDWILQRQRPPERVAELAAWTRDQLTLEEQDWLDTRPFSHPISTTRDTNFDFVVVHANPIDVNQLVFPSEAEQEELYGRVRQPDDELEPLFAESAAEVVAFGHLHVPNERTWQGKRLVNISSVGMPGDGDPRAKYGMFHWDGNGWHFERRYVDYGVETELEAYRRMQPPGWEEVVQIMEEKGYYPQNV